MMIPCVMTSGILILVWLACISTGSLVVFCLLFGFFSGAFVSLPPAVIASISSEPRKIGIRVGQSFTLISIGALIGTPISGALQVEDHGNYIFMAIFAGVIVLSGGALLTAARALWSRRIMVKV